MLHVYTFILFILLYISLVRYTMYALYINTVMFTDSILFMLILASCIVASIIVEIVAFDEMDGFDNIVLWCCCSICGVLLMLVIHPCVVSLLSSCYCLQSPTSKFAFVSAFNVVIMIMVNASLQEELNALKWGKYHHMNEIQQYSIISLSICLDLL